MSIFMQIDGVEGDAVDLNHTGWIDIIDLQWAVSRQITSASATQGDRESANAEITSLVFTKWMDRATPQLVLAACCGRGKTITIELTKTGDGAGADTYLAYTLHNTLVSSYQTEVVAQDAGRPLERLTLSFVELELKYTPYDNDGIALPPIAVAFDTATNSKR